MGLPTSYTQAHNQLADFFGKIRDAQAPEKFTLQLIKDLGYKSMNHRAFLQILKSLGFLSADGIPTSRYHAYRDHSASKAIMGQAIKEAYSDIFLIKEKPTVADKALIEGKFKSYHNASDVVASLMTKTFYSLLALADLSSDGPTKPTDYKANATKPSQTDEELSEETRGKKREHSTVGLHYNIQIHLPATKDIEVYSAIFRSLKEHLIE